MSVWSYGLLRWVPDSGLLSYGVGNQIQPSFLSWFVKVSLFTLVGTSLNHSEEENSRSGLLEGSLARPVKHTGSPTAWSSQFMGTCGKGCQFC